MLISYQWLQSYFEEKLPSPEKLAEFFTFHFSEVESLDRFDGLTAGKLGTGDWMFDLKILPDRACYALSHRGVAREIAAVLGREIMLPKYASPAVASTDNLSIVIEDKNDCARYIGRRVENLKVGESRQELKDWLAAIGQRSINNVVDAANYVMFDMGQPLHAFDAGVVRGAVVVRRAKKGEKIELLKSEKMASGGIPADWRRTGFLDENTLVIADDEGLLGIAGVKGGKRAGVGPTTTRLILEAAHFNPTLLRKTSERFDLRTDASKRFENNPSAALAAIAMQEFSALLAMTCPDAKFGEVVDEYPAPEAPHAVEVQVAMIEAKLGLKLGAEAIRGTLERLGIVVLQKGSGTFTLQIPPERQDLRIPEDIVEEVGRLVGYDKIPATLPPSPPEGYGGQCPPKQFYWEWHIRAFLVGEGFSEVMTSSFSEKGEVAIEKPLAEDKKYARSQLRGSFAAALGMNARNAPLFGADEVRMFEIGKVFPAFAKATAGKPAAGEHTALAIGYAGPKKKGKDMVAETVKKLSSHLGAELKGETKEGVFECDLDAVIEKLPEPREWNLKIENSKIEHFRPFSQYPFIVRDVALFVPAGTKPEAILKCIQKEAGTLAVRSWKFDEFEKGGKQSFAFRIVFQSFEKTLTDAEANAVMEKIYVVLKKEFQAEIR
ncbi:MAG: phenylalanine--tRNA ligase subunit beta [Candidatus Liptonbacteria bacterium]|nr:phenylalanine--tRNA ligase subunit beta [Candidatus Liptonbacteria bacterium]